MEGKCINNQTIPWMPIAGEDDSTPSRQVEQALQYSQLPSLLQNQSWTKSVPYKHWYNYVKPMESIGRTFTPKTYKYCMKCLTRRRQSSIRWHPFDSEGNLTFPPIQCIIHHEEEMKQKSEEKSKILEFKPDNIITLQELTKEKPRIKIKRTEKRAKEKRRNTEELLAIEEEVNG